MSFLQPALLFGGFLIGIPILIYLINRRRFRRRPWAAMEFLLRAMRKNRRRLRLENLLLLLLRCAILALLALAMARPFVRGTALTGLTGSQTSWIIAIDTSYSMNYREEGTSRRFELAQQAATQLVQSLGERDRVALMTLDESPRDLLVLSEGIDERGRGELLKELSELDPGYGSVDLAASLELALELAERLDPSSAKVSISEKRLVLFSDFQRRDWIADQGPKDPAVPELLRELEKGAVTVRCANLGDGDRNLSLVDLTVRPRLASRDVWMQIVATVRNTGRQDIDAAEIVFRVDGLDGPKHVVRVPAGSTVTRTLPYQFAEAGHHSVTVEVRGDRLRTDNRRHLALDVLDSAEVLLVDGDPGVSMLDRETFLLEIALMPEDSDEFRRTPYRPVVRTVDQVLAELPDLRNVVAVVLANVSAADLPSALVDRLGAYVARGGVLMVFAGDNVKPADYNRSFYRDDRTGLLPVRMERVQNWEHAPLHLEAAGDHPVAQFFRARAEMSYIGTTFIEVKRFISFESARAQPPGDVPAEGLDEKKRVAPAVILELTDPDRSPAFLDAPYGDGRTLWAATTADQAWNDFGKYPDFVPFLHEVLPYLVGFGQSQINLQLGEPIHRTVDSEDFAPEVLVRPPPAEYSELTVTPAAIPKELVRSPDGTRFVLFHEETRRPGVYEILMKRPEPGPGGWTEREYRYAVNLDPAEGDLRALSRDDIQEYFSGVKLELVNALEEPDRVTTDEGLAGGTEFWRQLLWIVLVLLLLESVLAYLFGRRHV